MRSSPICSPALSCPFSLETMSRPPFELAGAGCQRRDVLLFPAGSIRGQVLNRENRPVPDALVSILPAAAKELPGQQETYSVSPGEEGFFTFVHLPPGEYRLFVKPARPSTTAIPSSEEKRIQLRPGEQITGIDFHLQR